MPNNLRTSNPSLLARRLRRLTSMEEESTTELVIPCACNKRCSQKPSRPASEQLTTGAVSGRLKRFLAWAAVRDFVGGAAPGRQRLGGGFRWQGSGIIHAADGNRRESKSIGLLQCGTGSCVTAQSWLYRWGSNRAGLARFVSTRNALTSSGFAG